MEPQNESPEPPAHDDPEIAALLRFTPVVRRNRRRDGWPAEVQRGFIAALVESGSAGKAAHAVGRTMSGAYKVRTAGGGEEFAQAWDGAVDLYLARNPRVPRTGRWRPSDGTAPPPAEAPEPAAKPEPCAERRTNEEVFDDILTRYWLKVRQEREARLAGRIAAADFYVRQLTHIEIALDLGGEAHRLLGTLKRGGLDMHQIAATPMSVLLDKLRRDVWAEAGEPDRPPLPLLGRRDGEAAAGVATNRVNEFEGDYKGWRRREEEAAALAAEAQQAWEEKARADAAEWRRREAKHRQEGEP